MKFLLSIILLISLSGCSTIIAKKPESKVQVYKAIEPTKIVAEEIELEPIPEDVLEDIVEKPTTYGSGPNLIWVILGLIGLSAVLATLLGIRTRPKADSPKANNPIN